MEELASAPPVRLLAPDEMGAVRLPTAESSVPAPADDDAASFIGMWHDLLLGCLSRVAHACDAELKGGAASRADTDQLVALKAAADDTWHEISAFETVRGNSSAGTQDPTTSTWIAAAAALVRDQAQRVMAMVQECTFRHSLEVAINDLALVAARVYHPEAASSTAIMTATDAANEICVSLVADSMTLPTFSVTNDAELAKLKDKTGYPIGQHLSQLIKDHNSWVALAFHRGITHLGELPAPVLRELAELLNDAVGYSDDIEWPRNIRSAGSISAPFLEVLADIHQLLVAQPTMAARGRRRKKGRSLRSRSEPLAPTATLRIEVRLMTDDGIFPPLFDLPKAADLPSRGDPDASDNGERILVALVNWNDLACRYRAAHQPADKDRLLDELADQLQKIYDELGDARWMTDQERGDARRTFFAVQAQLDPVCMAKGERAVLRGYDQPGAETFVFFNTAEVRKVAARLKEVARWDGVEKRAKQGLIQQKDQLNRIADEIDEMLAKSSREDAYRELGTHPSLRHECLILAQTMETVANASRPQADVEAWRAIEPVWRFALRATYQLQHLRGGVEAALAADSPTQAQ